MITDFEEYIRQDEPHKREKGYAWQTAIGLQAVDGLKTSDYLCTFGFNINNEIFANYSWYFRNALVRTNYNNIPKGIFATTQYLEAFFRNLILSEQNELKNRSLYVSAESQSVAENAPKCNTCTLEELVLLNFIKEKPNATQKEIAAYIEK